MKLKLTLEYDGTGFRGWARQPGLRTVEGVVREALDAVFPSWAGFAVAGRTDPGFHARFSARSRSYRYRILARRTPSPLEARRALWWPRPVDLEALRAAAA